MDGDLDRICVVHKWLGIGAMAAVLLHDTIDAEMDGLGAETFIVELAETLGEISLYGLLILVALTVATFVPYHLWRWNHKFIGALFAFAATHYAFILKPFELSDPVGLYLLAFSVLGVLSYFYTLALHGALRGAARYQIAAFDQVGDATAVTLAPTGRGISAKPGQFAFFRFDIPGLGEVHPFTLS
jgi:predicted ferric reductase